MMTCKSPYQSKRFNFEPNFLKFFKIYLPNSKSNTLAYKSSDDFCMQEILMSIILKEKLKKIVVFTIFSSLSRNDLLL
jgi:hypothetical protein